MKFYQKRKIKKENLAVYKISKDSFRHPCLPNQTYFSMKKMYLYLFSFYDTKID